MAVTIPVLTGEQVSAARPLYGSLAAVEKLA